MNTQDTENYPKIQPFPDFITRALNYPYPAPKRSYTLERGLLKPFDHANTAGREPLLCIASNISPIQLLHKFGAETTVPVQRTWLIDYDVVFANRFASYGAIPGILYPSMDTVTFLAIAWLLPEQWLVMDESEVGGYERDTLNNIGLRTQEGDELSQITYYRSTFSPYLEEGRPLALSDIFAQKRRYPARCTAALLGQIFQKIPKPAAEFPFTRFLETLSRDADYRSKIAGYLSTTKTSTSS